MASLLIIGAAGAVALLIALQQWGISKARKLPPGPPPLPIIGNVFDLPPKGKPQWTHWLKQKDHYGPISSITVLGQTIISLNDRKAANEILEKRGVKNSSRPVLDFSFNMVGFGNYTIGQPYGENLRLHRKLMTQYIGSNVAVDGTKRMQTEEVAKTLLRMLDAPEELFQHFETLAGAAVIRLTYGYNVDTTHQDPVLFLVSRMMKRFVDSTSPGTWLVDSLPFLKLIPRWAPGGDFKNKADIWYKQSMEAANVPYEFVKRQLESNMEPQKSFVAECLTNAKHEIDENFETAVKFSAGTLFGGGADSTSGSLRFLFLAVLKFPEVLRKAQADIDRVVGTGRLPQFSDCKNLPYIEQIVNEVYRWQPVSPNGVAHSCDEDQLYDGYLIPKGAVLIANVRWFSQDPSVYHNPTHFIPERYSEPYNEPDPAEFIFGFGRRICPGRAFAHQLLILAVAQSFAAFNVERALDSEGKEIDPDLVIPPGQLSQPEDYPYRLTPRSEKYAQLIRENAHSLDVQDKQAGDAKLLETLGLTLDDSIATDDVTFSYA